MQGPCSNRPDSNASGDHRFDTLLIRPAEPPPMLERERIIEAVVAVSAVLLMLGAMMWIGYSYSDDGLTEDGAEMLVGAIVGFIFLLTAVGIGLAFALNSAEDATEASDETEASDPTEDDDGTEPETDTSDGESDTGDSTDSAGRDSPDRDSTDSDSPEDETRDEEAESDEPEAVVSASNGDDTERADTDGGSDQDARTS